MDWSRLPKVELHLHLDCSLSYAVVSQIDPSITLEEYRAGFVAPAKCVDLADCLTRASRGVALMQTEEQLRLVTFDLFEQLYQDNVLYAEIRFAPLLHTLQGLSARRVVASVEAATAQAVRSTGIEARLLLCTLRQFSAAQSLETVQLVEDFRGTYVAGFDIAADEAGYPIDAHVSAFQVARDRGIPAPHMPERRAGRTVCGKHCSTLLPHVLATACAASRIPCYLTTFGNTRSISKYVQPATCRSTSMTPMPITPLTNWFGRAYPSV
jgi:adenosine deaminase